jgi:multicomponent Na+:H+ antiporter subunit G
MPAMTNLLAMVFMCAGFFFFFATAVGIIRFPDFYNRMHAAGKGDTLSTMLMLAGLMLHILGHENGGVLTAAKVLLIAVFIFLASPTATHAIIDAGYESGLKPWTRDAEKGDGDDLAV